MKGSPIRDKTYTSFLLPVNHGLLQSGYNVTWCRERVWLSFIGSKVTIYLSLAVTVNALTAVLAGQALVPLLPPCSRRQVAALPTTRTLVRAI